jgi:hypothetical protein
VKKKFLLSFFLVFIGLNFLFSFLLTNAKTVAVTNTVLLEVNPSTPMFSTVNSIVLDIGWSTFGSRIIIEGTAPAGSRVDIYIQKGEKTYYKGQTFADEKGNWKLEIKQVFPPGKYSVWIAAVTDTYPQAESGKKEFYVPELKADMFVYSYLSTCINGLRSLSVIPRISILVLLSIALILVFHFLWILLLIIFKKIIHFLLLPFSKRRKKDEEENQKK